MKNLIFALLVMRAFSCLAYGDGGLFFANRIPGQIDARAALVGGGFPDSTYSADLAVLRNGVWEHVPGSTTPFRGTPGLAVNGYITGFHLSIPGFWPGAKVQVMMRGFMGASYEAAGGRVGQTHPVEVLLGYGTIPDPNLDGLGPNPWYIGIPEPSPIALGFAGTVALLLYRRWSRAASSP